MTMLQDFRYGIRTLRKAPGFTLVSILTLGLGIGATAVVYSWIAVVLTVAAPVGDMERLAAIWSDNPTQGEPKNVVSPQDFAEWRRRQTSFAQFAAQRDGAVNLSGTDDPARVRVVYVTADWFGVLGQQPILGRAFRPEEERPAAARVAVLGQRLWQERFSGRPDALGREILVDGHPTVVVGVLAENYFPEDLVLPLVIDPAAPAFTERALFVIGRLTPGTSLEQARAEMSAIGGQLQRELPDTHRGWGVNTRPLQEEFVGPQARIVFGLMAAAAAAILLIGCANIANLLLARGLGRSRELAVRTALGASRWQLARQMLAESLLLAAAGAGAGLLIAHWGLLVLRAVFSQGMRFMERAVVDGRVVAFAAGAALLSALVFGLLPALRGSRADVTHALRDGTRSTAGTRARWLQQSLVGSEVALAALFLVVSVLFLRTLTALQQIEPGFDTRNLLTMRLSLPEVRYGADAGVGAFYEDVVENMRAVPGITAAGAGARVPAAGSRWNPSRSLVIAGRPTTDDQPLFAADLTVTPGYLETLEIPLRAGRRIGEVDGAASPLVVVVSDTVVRRYFGGSTDTAVGARVRLGDEPRPDAWRTVVGVVGDIRNDDIDAPPLPMVYVPHAQRPARDMTLVMRTSGDPLAFVAAARAAVSRADPDQPVYEIKSMAQILEEDLRQSVLLIGIIGVFTAVALVLAAIGIYGVVAHAVAQRTHEIGVRMALGAALGDVLRLVLRQGAVPVVAGLAAGVAAGMLVSRLMTSVLYGVAPTDPVTYATVVLVLAGVAALACLAPAMRAARIDPLLALKAE